MSEEIKETPREAEVNNSGGSGNTNRRRGGRRQGQYRQRSQKQQQKTAQNDEAAEKQEVRVEDRAVQTESAPAQQSAQNRANGRNAQRNRRGGRGGRNSRPARVLSENVIVTDRDEADAHPVRPAAPVVEDKTKYNTIPDHWFGEEETEAAPEPVETVEIVGVRFKDNGKVYYFAPMGYECREDMEVIVETARGIEFGIVSIPNRQEPVTALAAALRPVVRIATDADKERHARNVEKEAEAMKICARKIEEHSLAMKLVEAEYTFDNSKLTFYFSADGRVDFRELVKDLASVFRTRIELRQIGIRDEAKLLGGLGICGRPFCCCTFLYDFNQVSIKMAKEQNLSLNSTKISGTCGRLMCCLRYENDVYDEEIKRTPRVDSIVRTKDGSGVVIDSQPLAGKVTVRFGDGDTGEVKSYDRDEVTVVGHRKGGAKPAEDTDEADIDSGEESPKNDTM